MFYLYLKTHNTSGLKYLGQTRRDPFEYKGSGKHWQRHIKKHGYDVSTIVLYETPFIEEIRELGVYYSDLWNIVESSWFANLIPETGDGANHTKETLRRIGITKIGNTNMLGKKHSDETKAKMRTAKLGKTFSDEHKRKMSESHLGKTGQTHTEESKKKMSEVKIGKTFSDEHKRKMSESHKNREKIACPHCGKICGKPQIVQWHGDNCATLNLSPK